VSDLHQDLGKLQGEFTAMERRVAVMERQLADVHGVVMRAQGSWRALVVVGSVSAAAGALLAKLAGAVAALLGAGR
jgi:hypothetical protein